MGKRLCQADPLQPPVPHPDRPAPRPIPEKQPQRRDGIAVRHTGKPFPSKKTPSRYRMRHTLSHLCGMTSKNIVRAICAHVVRNRSGHTAILSMYPYACRIRSPCGIRPQTGAPGALPARQTEKFVCDEKKRKKAKKTEKKT